jgi:uncharacterized protein YndB with AHSA1/START domain
MLKKVLIGLILVVGGFVAYAATRPASYRVERSTKVEAPAAVVFSQLEDFKAWAAWSPWEKLDPQMKKTFEGPAKGVGAVYSWEGNKKVGKGKMTITESQPPTLLRLRLEFMEPFAGIATTTFTLTPEGDKATGATWAMEGTNNLMGKMFGVFMPLDKAIGGSFEQGLASLKAISETEAKKQADEEAAKKKQAEAAAQEAAKAQAAAAQATAGKGHKGRSAGKHKR